LEGLELAGGGDLLVVAERGGLKLGWVEVGATLEFSVNRKGVMGIKYDTMRKKRRYEGRRG